MAYRKNPYSLSPYVDPNYFKPVEDPYMYDAAQWGQGPPVSQVTAAQMVKTAQGIANQPPTPARGTTMPPPSSLFQRVAESPATPYAIAGAQMAAQMIPTSADIANRRKLKELQGLAPGELTADRQSAVEQLRRETFTPARSAARESRLRTEAMQAAGQGTSAATQTRAAREERRDVQQAGMATGLAVGREKLQLLKDQMGELESRTKEKAERQLQRRGAFATGLAQAGQIAGQARAATAAKEIDWESIQAEHPEWNADDLMMFMNEYEQAPTWKREQLKRMAFGA